MTLLTHSQYKKEEKEMNVGRLQCQFQDLLAIGPISHIAGRSTLSLSAVIVTQGGDGDFIH